MRKQKGITLIALVITIIVLLILVSITLGLLLGENGIVNKSRKAVVDHEIGREKEEISLAFNAVKLEKLGKGDDSYVTFIELQEQMDQENGEGTAEVDEGEEEGILLITFTKSKRTYEIDQNGNIKLNNDDDLPLDIEIYAIEDLVDLSIAVNNGEKYEGKVIGLMKTLDFQDSSSYRNPNSTEYGDLNGNGTAEALISELNNGGYNPIGVYDESQENSNRPFKGTFDGRDNSIKHVCVKNKANAGFFGYIEDATIKKLKLEDISTLNGNKNIGTLAACTGGNSKIKNCSATNQNNTLSGASNIGGLVGLSKDSISIKESSFETIPPIIGSETAGGILGKVQGNATLDKTSVLAQNYIAGNGTLGGVIGEVTGSVKVKKVLNEATINGGSVSAGIIGKIIKLTDEDKVYIYGVSNEGTLNGQNPSGIIGSIEDIKQVTLQNCNNTGTIQGYGYTSGIIANVKSNKLEITNTYNTGEIIGGGYNIAGIIAQNEIKENITIDNCYNKGKITDNSQYGARSIAGIIAYMRGDYNNPNTRVIVKNSYNEGELECSKTSGNIAGIIGTAEYLNIELISNCYNTTNIDKDNTERGENIGGIIGYNSGKIYKIEKCYNTGNIKNGNYVGGIVAYTAYTRNEENNTVIEECYNTGNITDSYSIGGIVGYYYNSSNNAKLEIKKCNNTAEMKGILDSTASSNSNNLSNAAGIIGTANVWNVEMEFNECYNKGNISSSEYSGGILGEIYSTPKKIRIYKCFNEGKIKIEKIGRASGYSAGIIPYIGTGNLEIDSCYNIGKIITFSEKSQVGGIVGSISGKNSTIKNSYNTGEIELPYGGRDAGGIASYTVNTNVTNCYNTGDIKIGTSSEEKPEIKVPNISYGSSGLVSIGSGIWSGGILGYATETKVEDCYNTGNIICKAEALNKDGTEEPGRILIGGLIGALYSTNNGDSYVKRCYNTAQITIEAQKQYVAGVIGFYWWWNCDAPEAVYYTDSKYKFASNDYNDMNTTEGKLKTIDELKQDSILNSLNNGRNTWKKGANGLPTINM